MGCVLTTSDPKVVTVQNALTRESPAPPETIASRAIGLVKVYGSGEKAVRALDNVTVGFPAERFTAIMGPSGSGKSTLMHCLAGLDTPTSGTVLLGDVDLAGLSDKKLTLLRRERVGFVFQAFNLVPMLTAGENLTLPLTLAGTRPDPDWIGAVTGTMGLADRLSYRPAQLSGGQQQVAVARALASRPQVIFADEPTGNLDSKSGGELLGLLREVVDEFGHTVVMVTHDPLAAGHADAVVFLADGHLAGHLEAPTPQRVLEQMKTLGG